jgi:hypothetical protein
MIQNLYIIILKNARIATFGILMLFSVINTSQGQDLGLSFSYFIPKNGYFSVPVTPFSLRGVGFDLTKNIALESGFTLYRISGMGVKNLPWESQEPLIGPFFSILVPAELVFTVFFDNQAFKIKGGGFAFYNFDTNINEGNLDRELLEYTGWEVLNSDMQVSNQPGFGYHFGAEYIIYLSKKFGISLEAYYLAGQTKLDLRGTYKGLPPDASSLTEETVEFDEAMLDFTGYELSIGVLFTP